MDYEGKARRIKTLEALLTQLAHTKGFVEDVQVERMHLLQQVPVEFMRAYRDAQRADETYKHPNEKGIFYNVRKIDPFGNEDGISGLEWGSRKTVMRQRAANTKQEWKDKMNAEGRDEHGRVLERERE